MPAFVDLCEASALDIELGRDRHGLCCLAPPMNGRRTPMRWIAAGLLVALPACEGGILGDGAQLAPPTIPSASGGGGAIGPETQAPSALPEGACSPHQRLRKLTPEQVEATARALGLPELSIAQRLRDTLPLSDAAFSSHASRLDMSLPHVLELAEAAKSIAAAATRPGGPAAHCLDPAAPADCVPNLLASLGKRAFRRPLTREELASFAEYYAEQRLLDDAATSLETVLRALVMSPAFLFRSELGAPDAPGPMVTMTAEEVASAIAYYLTDGPPDAALTEAAERGELAAVEGRAAHVRRLIGSETLSAGLSRFFGEYFRTAAVGSVSARDMALYPTFSNDVARAYGLETQAFYAEVMLRDDARFSTLLTAPYVMVNALTAPFYGISGVTGDAPVRQVPPAGQRAGILTQASWLTRFAHDKEGNPVSRGRFVRERLMCQPVPPPPPTVDATPVPPDGQRTQRERLAAHSTDPSCAGCHQLMDPLGLAFESYDAVGRYRAQELGRPVDTSGSTADATGATYQYRDAAELVTQLATSPGVQDCFSRQVYFYAQGLKLDELGACAYAAHAERIAASGGSIIDLVVELMSSETFYLRSKEQP